MSNASGFCQKPEIPLNTRWCTHANLNVVLFPKARTRVQRRSFKENASNSVVTEFALTMQCFYHRAVKISSQQFAGFFVPFVLGHAGACDSHGRAQEFVGFLNYAERLRFQKIQALTRIDNGPKDKWFLYWDFPFSGFLPKLLGKLQSPVWIVFPEVDSMTEPVVLILAVTQVQSLAGKYFLSYCSVAAMKAKY